MIARRLIFSLGAVVLCASAFTSASASALQGHSFSTSFGSAGSEAGEMALRGGEGEGEVADSGVAIDAATHDVYVADTGNARVDEFEADGTFLRAWGWGVADGTPAFETCTLMCEKGLAGSGSGQFTAPALIAVDNSGGPSQGDVYVGDTGTGVVSKFSATGAYLSSNNGSGAVSPVAGPFGPLAGVAVDGSGELWVYDTSGDMFKFASDGSFLTDWNSGRGVIPAGIAVDSSTNIDVETQEPGVAGFSPTGVQIGNVIQGDPTGLTVDSSTGDLFVDEGTTVNHILSSCDPLQGACTVADAFGAGTLARGAGLAVDSTDNNVYVADQSVDRIDVFTPILLPAAHSGEVTNAVEGSVTLTGTVEPEGEQVTSCEFQYVADSEYQLGATDPYSKGVTVPCQPTPGTATVAVTAKIKVSPGIAYDYRLVATNKNGENVGVNRTFREGAVISNESSSNVESEQATVSAQIDADGQVTEYQVEYGTSTNYGSSTLLTNIGAPSGEVNLTTHLVGLQPATQYHFRFVAVSLFGRTLGTDMTFTSPGAVASSSLLPDSRKYELVSTSPPNGDMYHPETGGEVFPEDVGTLSPSRVAADGDSATYLGEPPAEGGAGTTGMGLGNQYLATRAASGWVVKDITPVGSDANTRYEYFSSNLSSGFFSSETPITPATPAGTPECLANPYSYTTDDESFHGLVSSLPKSGPSCSNIVFGGASANGSHSIFESISALTLEAGTGAGQGNENLYDLVGRRLIQVNLLPDGHAEPVPGASFGSRAAVPNQEAEPQEPPDFSNAISSDGSRIFWSNYEVSYREAASPFYKAKSLYVRENDTQPQSPIGPHDECTVSADACTVQIDAGEQACVAEAKCGSGEGRFWTASADGSKVFFTDCVKLTGNSTADPSNGCQSAAASSPSHPTGNDLYEYNVDTGRLADLTVDGNPGDPLGADVQGMIGASEDGSYVYFVANGALTPDAPLNQGDNLYVLYAGSIHFVARLASIDNEVEPIASNSSPHGDWRGALGERTAEVTPDGHDLAFMSVQPLTGYENGGQREAFVYDAVTGKISCASCHQNGAPASKVTSIGNYLPASNFPGFMNRFISADGNQVFFETNEALVPQDTNGLQDVYEWERDGAGSCHSAVEGQSKDGCVYILSGGESSDSAFFLDADVSGDNVFLTSRGELSPQAQNESVAVYDARVNGGFDVPSLGCTGTGCQGVPPPPPIFATPSSVTFNGVGNFALPAQPVVKSKPKSKIVKCRRGFVKKHGKCVRKRHRRKTTRSSRRPENRRKR
ncbi:MAG: hypothetical protein WBV85_07580 [Solirubrobacteraceae bacterium]